MGVFNWLDSQQLLDSRLQIGFFKGVSERLLNTTAPVVPVFTASLDVTVVQPRNLEIILTGGGVKPLFAMAHVAGILDGQVVEARWRVSGASVDACGRGLMAQGVGSQSHIFHNCCFSNMGCDLLDSADIKIKELQDAILEHCTENNSSTGSSTRRDVNPRAWGPSGWKFVDVVIKGCPTRSRHGKQVQTFNFLTSLGHILPCAKCRKRHIEFALKCLCPPVEHAGGRHKIHS